MIVLRRFYLLLVEYLTNTRGALHSYFSIGMRCAFDSKSLPDISRITDSASRLQHDWHMESEQTLPYFAHTGKKLREIYGRNK